MRLEKVKVKFSCLIFLIFSFIVGATGAEPPAGMEGLLYLAIAAIVILIVIFVIIILVIKKFYKKSKNKQKFKRLLKWVFSILISCTLFIMFLWVPGYVIFTSYKIIENNPLEESVEITMQKDYYYFEFSDGRILEFMDKRHRYVSTRDKEERLDVGKRVMLEENKSKEQFTMYSLGKTHDYYWYMRNMQNVLLTIPLIPKEIIRYDKEFEGKLRKPDSNTPMDEKHLVRAIEKAIEKDKCCDIDWIKVLIAKGANSKGVINKKQLVHRFISRTDNDYYLKNREIVMPILLAAGNVNVNLTDNYERTILQLAIAEITDTRNVRFNQPDKEFVNYLINAGVDPNIPDNKGNTALHNSIKEHNFNLSKLLIDNGADLNLKNKRGKSTLYLLEDYLENDDINKGVVFFSKEQQKELMELKEYIDES